MMRFDDFRMEIVAEQFGSFVRQKKKHIDSNAEIRREHDRQRLRGIANHLTLLLRISSRPDDKRLTII